MVIMNSTDYSNFNQRKKKKKRAQIKQKERDAGDKVLKEALSGDDTDG